MDEKVSKEKWEILKIDNNQQQKQIEMLEINNSMTQIKIQ